MIANGVWRLAKIKKLTIVELDICRKCLQRDIVIQNWLRLVLEMGARLRGPATKIWTECSGLLAQHPV
eukprot:scaffold478363_cov19-Prasinocladus_malaysianus.AAC.1